MREIKFRQPLLNPDKTFNHFHYWGIIEGTFIGRDQSGNLKGDDEQYIGQHDRNGTEIYEGDKIKWCGSDGEIRFDVVCYSFAKFYLCNSQYSVYEYLACELVVTGNIWENPELLKGE
ncbi:MAG TPA: YopX family protein [Dehalococcoidia bacterium]|nr:YopX family protein [Dehalococcoidia bacterium]